MEFNLRRHFLGGLLQLLVLVLEGRESLRNPHRPLRLDLVRPDLVHGGGFFLGSRLVISPLLVLGRLRVVDEPKSWLPLFNPLLDLDLLPLSVLFEEDVHFTPQVFPEAAGFPCGVPRDRSTARLSPILVNRDDSGPLCSLLHFGFPLVLALCGLRQPWIIG